MKKLFLILFVVIIVSTLIFTSCSAPASPPTPSPTPSPSPAPAPAQKQADRYIFYTMPPGTSVYLMGVGLSSLVNQYTDLKTIVQPFPSPFGSFDLITKNQHHFNTQASFSVYANALGLSDAFFPDIEKNKGYPKLRLIMAAYRQFFSWMTRKDTGIKSIEDLKGKTISAEYKVVRPATVIAQSQLAAYGIDYQKDCKNVPFPSSTAAMQALIDKKIDACLDVPTASTSMELEFKHGQVVLPFPPELMNKIPAPEEGLFNGPLPDYTPGLAGKKIPGTYALAMFITGEDVPEDVVYQVVKATIEHSGELAPTNIDFKDFNKDNAIPKYPILPFHPGAIKYFKEIGIWNADVEAKHSTATERIKKVEQKPIK